MKRILIMFTTAVAILALAFGANPASAQYDGSGGEGGSEDGCVALSAVTVYAGDSITVEGDGCFGANESLQVHLYSEPVLLATLVADAQGSFSGVVTIPADTQPGEHEMAVSGKDADGQDFEIRGPVTVLAPAGGQSGGSGTGGTLSRTGSNVLPLVGIGAAALLLGGAFIYGARKPSEA